MDVERALQGRSYPADTKKGWQVFTHTGSDGKARPYHVYAPKGYDPARKHPAIVKVGLTQIFAMKKGDTIGGEYRCGDAIQTFRVEVPELPRVPIFKRTLPPVRGTLAKCLGSSSVPTLRNQSAEGDNRDRAEWVTGRQRGRGRRWSGGLL